MSFPVESHSFLWVVIQLPTVFVLTCRVDKTLYDNSSKWKPAKIEKLAKTKNASILITKSYSKSTKNLRKHSVEVDWIPFVSTKLSGPANGLSICFHNLHFQSSWVVNFMRSELVKGVLYYWSGSINNWVRNNWMWRQISSKYFKIGTTIALKITN